MEKDYKARIYIGAAAVSGALSAVIGLYSPLKFAIRVEWPAPEWNDLSCAC